MANPFKAASLFVIGAVSLGAMTVWQPRDSKPVTSRENAPILAPIAVPPAEDIRTHVIQRGETLSGALTRLSVVGQDLADAILVLREHQNPRRLTAGAEITVHRWVSSGAPRSVQVRINADTTVVLAKNDLGWDGSLVLTPVVVDTVFVSGEIEEGRPLYTSLVLDETVNLPVAERVQLASKLGEIYQYTIDFSREIQPGDRYQIAYEREARPDGTARNRRILISEFVNKGKPLNAIYFKKGAIEGYYSKTGESLRQGFRRSPLDFTRVTSSFSSSRYHPVLGIYRAHLGTDYGAAYGTPIYAVADGSVVSAGTDRGYGKVVVLRHFGGYTTRYAHMRGFAKGIRAGTRVSQNQVIGYVGSTGLATGPHLHYELRHNGKPVNSRQVKLPGAPAIPADYRADFNRVMTERVGLLDQAVAAPHYADRSIQERAGGD